MLFASRSIWQNLRDGRSRGRRRFWNWNRVKIQHPNRKIRGISKRENRKGTIQSGEKTKKARQTRGTRAKFTTGVEHILREADFLVLRCKSRSHMQCMRRYAQLDRTYGLQCTVYSVQTQTRKSRRWKGLSCDRYMYIFPFLLAATVATTAATTAASTKHECIEYSDN